MEGVGTVKDAVTVELPEGTGTELTYAEMEIPHEAFPAAASYILDRQSIPTEHRMLAVTTDEGTVILDGGERLVIEGPEGFDFMFRDRAAYQACVDRTAKAFAQYVDDKIMAEYLKGGQ